MPRSNFYYLGVVNVDFRHKAEVPMASVDSHILEIARYKNHELRLPLLTQNSHSPATAQMSATGSERGSSG